MEIPTPPALTHPGEGLEYHMSKAFCSPPKLKKSLSFVIDGIPIERLIDSSFWYMLYRPYVYRDEVEDGAQMLYEVLLPYLNSRPLYSNYADDDIAAVTEALEDGAGLGAPPSLPGARSPIQEITTDDIFGAPAPVPAPAPSASTGDFPDDPFADFAPASAAPPASNGGADLFDNVFNAEPDPAPSRRGAPPPLPGKRNSQQKAKTRGLKRTGSTQSDDAFAVTDMLKPNAFAAKKRAAPPPLPSVAEKRLSRASKPMWRTVPRGGDLSRMRCVLEACHYLLRCLGLTVTEAKHVALLTRWAMVRMVLVDLKFAKHMNTADTQLIKASVRQLSYAAAKQALLTDSPTTASHLMNIKQCENELERRLDEISKTISFEDKSIQPKFVLSANRIPSSSTAHPLYGRFRRDTDVEKLIGGAPKQKIIRSVELTLVQSRVQNFNDVANALRHCAQLCTLMSYQTDLIKNTYMLRASLIVHLFTDVIPMPLPTNHPQRDTQCFWASQPMRYETQTDLLRLINHVCRHFCAASLSLQVTRSFDAARILTMACMVCVADAVMRVIACDIPSQLALHYSGKSPGAHVHPFGVEMRIFAKESESFMFLEPALALVRTQVLDYFYEQRKVVRADHIIFAWEHSMDIGIGEISLLDQLCLQIGFPRNLTAEYLTGQSREVLDDYPELAFFRDIVFILKVLMVPTCESLPEIKAWMPSDARLHWEYKKKKAEKVRDSVYVFVPVLLSALPVARVI